MNLIYIAYGNVSVFDSQVVALLNQYVETNQFNKIILILGVDYRTGSGINKIKNLDKKIRVEVYKQYPQYFLIEKLTILSISKILKEINNVGDFVIHVRNDVLSHYTYKALKKLGCTTNRMIADVRGAGLEQLIEFSNKSKFILWLKKAQRHQVNKSLGIINNLSVVSESLKLYVHEKVNKEINVRVNSCLSNRNFQFIEEERKNLREKLNIRDKEFLLVLSTGGDNAWQNTKQTIETLTERNFKILNLSRTKINHKNVITKFVPYDEMYKYLCAADAAIIFRKNGITNQVASPVKFSEYVCCGLPVLTNRAVDLISDYMELNDCGKILDALDEIDNSTLEYLKRIDRKTISITGQKHFGIENISNQYIEFYKSI